MGVAERLRGLRKARGWTQPEAARAAGLSVRTLMNYEAGRRTPRAELLVRLAAGYGVTVDHLLTGGAS